ncbi:potassium channel protein, partial [Candidatus Bathyarchaeota archaeon ex4484_231]
MSEFEKIEYEPHSVRELLLEMKDTSELMIDLAYSAALFNDRELAEEVLELESHVDLLAYQLNMSTMIAARDPEDAESLVAVLKVASSADKISDAAADIAAIVLRKIGVHPLVSKVFKKVEEGLVKAIVKSNSILAGKSL